MRYLALAICLLIAGCDDPESGWSNYFTSGETACFAQDIPEAASVGVPVLLRVTFSFGPVEHEGFENGFDASGRFFGFVGGYYSDDEESFPYFSYKELTFCMPDGEDFKCAAHSGEEVLLRMAEDGRLRVIDESFKFNRGVTRAMNLTGDNADRFLKPLTPAGHEWTSDEGVTEFDLSVQKPGSCKHLSERNGSMRAMDRKSLVD